MCDSKCIHLSSFSRMGNIDGEAYCIGPTESTSSCYTEWTRDMSAAPFFYSNCERFSSPSLYPVGMSDALVISGGHVDGPTVLCRNSLAHVST